MSHDSRTLVLILVVIGCLACGCIVAPLSVVGLLFYRYDGARAEVEAMARTEAQHEEELRERLNMPADDLTTGDLTLPDDGQNVEVNVSPSATPEDVNVAPGLPAAPAKALPPPPGGLSDLSPAGANPAGSAGLSGGPLSDTQKRFIYRTARIHRQIVEQMEQTFAEQKGRGINTSVFEKILADTRARQEQNLDELCRQRKITRAELDAILVQGDKEGW